MEYKEDNFKDIIWEEQSFTKTIKEASLSNLITCLSSPEYSNPEYVKQFLTTFNSFTTPKELLKILYQRFNYPPKGNIDIEFINYVFKIRDKIVDFLKKWIEKYYFIDFDEELRSYLERMIIDIKKTYKGSNYSLILERYLGYKELEEKPIIFEHVLGGKQFSEEQINLFLSQEPLKVAQQMALIHSESFRMISKTELLNRNFNNKNDTIGVKNCYNLFNHFINLFSTIVVKSKSISESTKKIEQLILLAESSFKLNDFESTFCIIDSLQKAGVARLAYSWSKVDYQIYKIYDQIQVSTSRDGSYRNLKELMNSCKPPFIPFIGYWFTLLSFIEDGNLDFINEINFRKRRHLYGVIKSIEESQCYKYQFEKDSNLQYFLLHFNVLTDMDLYKQSLILQPKNKDNKNISK